MVRLRQKKKHQQIPILLLHMNKSLVQFSVKDISEFKPVLDKNVQNQPTKTKHNQKKPSKNPNEAQILCLYTILAF